MIYNLSIYNLRGACKQWIGQEWTEILMTYFNIPLNDFLIRIEEIHLNVILSSQSLDFYLETLKCGAGIVINTLKLFVHNLFQNEIKHQ
jgi:hypothetical protein